MTGKEMAEKGMVEKKMTEKGMTEKELHELFRRDSSRIPIDQERKARSLFLLNRAIEGKKTVPLASGAEIIRGQMRFLDYRLTAVQGMGCLLLFLFYRSLHGTLKGGMLYLPVTASAPVFGMLMMMACSRGEAQGMAELAGSCFFNYRQVCALRLVFHGIANLLALTGLSVVLCGYLERSAVETGIYFLVPFLMTGCVQFAILLSGFGQKSYAQAAGGLTMTAVWAGMSSFPRIYGQAALTVWFMALAVCIAGFGTETAVVLKRMERGDLLCMN